MWVRIPFWQQVSNQPLDHNVLTHPDLLEFASQYGVPGVGRAVLSIAE